MLIDEKLARAKALVARGTPKSKVYETTIANGITTVEALPTLDRVQEIRTCLPLRR